MDSNQSPQQQPFTKHRFTFQGRGGEYFKIWIVNILLSIITLGIYSAWAKVRNNQYFYGNTFLNNASFEYTALPMQILKGRIVAVFALFGVNTLSQIMPTVGSILFLFIFLAMPWVVMKALAFNARNSRYKNIHFNFAQNFGESFKVFVLLPILYIITLGLAFPYFQYRLKHYIVSNHYFGKSAFKFNLDKAEEFYYVYIKAFLFMIILIVISMLIFSQIDLATIVGSDLVASLLGTLLIIFVYMWLYAFIQSHVYNLTYQHAEIDKHKFYANMPSKGLAILYLTNTLGILLTLGLFIPWAKVRAAQFRARYTEFHASEDLDQFIANKIEKQNALGEELGEQFGDALDIDLGI